MIPEVDDDYISSEDEMDEKNILDPSYLLDPQNAPSRKAKTVLEKELEFQIRKRTIVIDELRKAYLRDVVAVKYIVDEVLTNTEKRAFFDQWKDTVPSVDLKDALVLRSPYHGALNVAPCRRCGGTVNVLFSETQKVKDLTARVETLSTRNELLRLMIATQEAQSEKVSTELAETKTSHFEEKKFLYAEVKRLKEEIEEAAIKSRQAAAANKRMKQESLKQISAHEDLTIRALANEKALERAIEMNTEQKQVIQDLKESIRGYQSGNMDLESKIGEMDKRLKYKDELIEKQAVVLKEISSEVTELKDQVEKQREFSKIAENAADIADRAKESLVEENRKLEVLIEKQVHITEALEDRVETLKEELQTLTAELDQTRSSLNQSRFDCEMQRNMVAGLELKVELRDERIVDLGIEQSQLKERFAAELLDQTKQFEMRQADLEEEIQILLRTRHKTNKKETGDYDQEEYADEDNLEELEYEDDDCEESTPGGSAMEKAQGMRSGRKGGGGHVGFDTASSLNDTRYAPKAVASRGGVKAKGAGLRLQIPSHVAKSNATKKSSISSGDIQPLAEANTSPMAKKYTPSPKKRTSIVDETSNKKAYKKVEYVELLPASDPSSTQEKGMRDAVLSLLAQSFDEVTARKTVNVLAPFLARRAKVLDAALSGMGRAICAQRATANLRVEAQSLVAGALMSNSAADVDLVISRLKESNKTERESTIQGLSSAVPLDVSTASHESTDVDDVVSYMQSLGGEHIEPTDSDTLQEEINKLQTELVNSRQFFSDTLMTVAQEWAEAKKVALVIDSTVAEAKRKVHEELDPIVCDQAAEVKKLRGKLDTEAAGRKLLMQKYNDLSTEVSKLRPRSDRLHDTEERSRFLQKAHDLMEISLREVKLKLSQTERDVKDREDKLLAAENILNEKDSMITGNRKNMRVMRQSLTQQNAQLMELSQSLLLMNEQEFHRVNCLIEVGVQCQPEVAEMDIQTEFIIPAMSLATSLRNPRPTQTVLSGGTHVASPMSTLGSAAAADYLADRKRNEFEKGLEGLRMGLSPLLGQGERGVQAPLSALSKSFSRRAAEEERLSLSRSTNSMSPSKRLQSLTPLNATTPLRGSTRGSSRDLSSP